MTKKLSILDLFSGVGGFSLGLERTGGFKTVAFCEIDPYCQRVLRRHWPDVPVYGDVRALAVDEGWLVSDADKRREPTEEQLCTGRQRIRANSIDVICGGFPCQDISVAGKGAGIGGERSGLWSEYARIIGEVRPRYVIVENVAALLVRGMGRVLGDLSALGYDAEWSVISVADVGAPHLRRRVWIVAYPAGEGWRSARSAIPGEANGGRALGESCGASDVGLAGGARLALGPGTLREWAHAAWWATEPDVGRVAHGVPARVDRLRALGNAVVPQIPELIGRAIMRAALEPKP